jgi:hypothetical protein
MESRDSNPANHEVYLMAQRSGRFIVLKKCICPFSSFKTKVQYFTDKTHKNDSRSEAGLSDTGAAKVANNNSSSSDANNNNQLTMKTKAYSPSVQVLISGTSILSDFFDKSYPRLKSTCR